MYISTISFLFKLLLLSKTETWYLSELAGWLAGGWARRASLIRKRRELRGPQSAANSVFRKLFNIPLYIIGCEKRRNRAE